ncbi:hypothetical protein B0H34DRAFT_667269 [Crassisporium funariophilum]|nr:hypothetical protein B0H34DRAFT_667269 [Crassisporium funariophilum]
MTARPLGTTTKSSNAPITTSDANLVPLSETNSDLATNRTESNIPLGIAPRRVVTSAPVEPLWFKHTCVEVTSNHDNALIARTGDEHPGSHATRAVLVMSNRLWDNGATLTYGFLDRGPLGYAQVNQQRIVRSAVKVWEEYANVVFECVDNIASATIRISFKPEEGSWSFTGNEALSIRSDTATMNLGLVTGDVSSDEEYASVLHQVGHALGLMHEHQSPTLGDKIILKEKAVVALYQKTGRWKEPLIKSQIISVYNTHGVSNFLDFDQRSIMLYYMPPEMTMQGLPVRPNMILSDLDKAFITINYPHGSVPSNDMKSRTNGIMLNMSPLQQFERALDVFGVEGEVRSCIMNFYNDGNWKDVRFEFLRFCNKTRIARKARTNPLRDSTTSPLDKDAFMTKDVENPFERYLWLPGERITYSWVQGSLHATKYRKRKVEEAFSFYSQRVNLAFEEIPFNPKNPTAKIHVFFGPISKPSFAGWSKIGERGAGLRQTQRDIDKRGGFSIMFSPMVSANETTDIVARKSEQRTLHHQLGHALGLQLRLPLVRSSAVDKGHNIGSVAALYDEPSVMLDPGCTFCPRDIPQEVKDHLTPGSNEYSGEPSAFDLALLGGLYPSREGHVDDLFERDIKNLGLLSKLQVLSDQRNRAFSYEGRSEFPVEIQKLRAMIQEGLDVLAAARIETPAHTVIAPQKARDLTTPPRAAASKANFLDELSRTLSTMFRPSTGQIFALQFPGRSIAKDQYAWDTSAAGTYGQFVKPTVVSESEFRLVDQLYNVGQVVGAPNGTNLSIVYQQVLNNLIPRMSAINLSKQQAQIRQWLLKDVPASGWVKDLIKSQQTISSGATTGSGVLHAVQTSFTLDTDIRTQGAVINKLPEDRKITRMELAEALVHEYLAARQAWELERDEMIKSAKGNDLNEFSRKLSHLSSIRESQLAAKHADAVVRGYSHAVRQYLGFMDVKNPAEYLQDAKDALRESSCSSLDGSMQIYPVQMQPIDWFQSLSTSFTAEDLTDDDDFIAQQLDSRSKQLDVLSTHLAIHQRNPKASVLDVQAKLEAAHDAYDKAQAELNGNYNSNVMSIARTCINGANDFVEADFKIAAKKAGIPETAYYDIEKGMAKLTTSLLSVAQASRAVTQLMTSKSLASATDNSQEIIQLNIEITSLTKDITELTTRLQSLRYKPAAASDQFTHPNAPRGLETFKMFPAESRSSGGSRWQEVYVTQNITTRYSSSSERSKSVSSKDDISLFLGCYHSESNASSATSTSKASSASTKVELGFRATMVTVDRAGWFQPQFFKQSANFHCIDKDVSWSKWPDNIESIQDLSKDGGAGFEQINKSLLPAYPTGFIICKDITIKIHMQDADMDAASEEMEKYAATSAGILCFSTNSSSQSKSMDKSYTFTQTSDGCVIRIPGPQILGYILQLTDKDETTPIPEQFPQDFLVSDVDYDASAHTAATHTAQVSHTTHTSTTHTAPHPHGRTIRIPHELPRRRRSKLWPTTTTTTRIWAGRAMGRGPTHHSSRRPGVRIIHRRSTRMAMWRLFSATANANLTTHVRMRRSMH